MAAPAQVVQDYLSGSRTRLYQRADIYEPDGVTIWDSTERVIDGSVAIDSTRDERRTLELTLDNFDRALNHDPNGFWYDKIIKIVYGLDIRDSTIPSYEFQLGEFLIDSIGQDLFPHQIKVSGRDYTKRCMLSKFTQATSFASGQAIETLIGALAANAGITKMNLPISGKTTGKEFVYERDTDRWTVMKEISDSYGYELFFDANGILIMREYRDPVTSPITYTFQTGDIGNLVDLSKTVNDSRLYNHIVVTGESADSSVPPVFAEAINTQPSSPSRVARLGDRVYQYTSAFITTTAQAQDVADKFLKIHSLEEFDMNFSSIPAPWLEAGDIVQILDPEAGPSDPFQFLLSSLSIPIGLGVMTGNAKRVEIVG